MSGKKIKKTVLILSCAILLAGCGECVHSGKNVSTDALEQALKNQTETSENEGADVSDSASDTDAKRNEANLNFDTETGNDNAPDAGKNNKQYDYKTDDGSRQPTDVDYDLTEMDGDMVYAMVYQIMMNPSTYVGKTFRIEGTYHSVYYEMTGTRYHSCIIKDALGCCAQGLEFVWDDGNHVYPDEYPQENTEIVVEGTLGTYQEEGDKNIYCRLEDATMKVL